MLLPFSPHTYFYYFDGNFAVYQQQFYFLLFPQADCVIMTERSVDKAGLWENTECEHNKSYICQMDSGKFHFSLFFFPSNLPNNPTFMIQRSGPHLPCRHPHLNQVPGTQTLMTRFTFLIIRKMPKPGSQKVYALKISIFSIYRKVQHLCFTQLYRCLDAVILQIPYKKTNPSMTSSWGLTEAN